jgi:hypothetical protein
MVTRLLRLMDQPFAPLQSITCHHDVCPPGVVVPEIAAFFCTYANENAKLCSVPLAILSKAHVSEGPQCLKVQNKGLADLKVDVLN